MAVECNSVVEHLPRVLKALGFVPSTEKINAKPFYYLIHTAYLPCNYRKSRQ
jgi:hypothetical protein